MPLCLEAGAEPVSGYRLVRRLGEGGGGEAWEAIAPGSVRVALKFVRLDSALAGPELRSLEVIREIRHPHLLDVQFILQVENRLIVAMPLCDKSLADRLAECLREGLAGVPRDELLGHMGEMAAALDFLNEPRHRMADGGLVGVQHRDVKPHNVFLVGGSVRLADFGLAKVLEAGTGDHSGCMTPHYAAPELIEGKISARSDQYSLAVTYVKLRTGELPFRGTVADVLMGHLHAQPDLSGLPERERAAVLRALAKRPDERWPNCREFVKALERAAGAEPEPARRGAPADRTAGPLADPTWSPRPPSTLQGGVTTVVKETSGAPEDLAGQSGPREAPRRRPRWMIWLGAALAACAAFAVLSVPAVLFLSRPVPPFPEVTFPSAGERETKLEPPSVPPSPPTPSSPPAPAQPGPVQAAAGQESASRPADRPAEAERKASPVKTANETPREDPPAKARPPDRAAPPPAPPVLAQAAAAGAAAGGKGAADLPAKARAILKNFCHRCHGVRFEVPEYNVLDRDRLVARRGEGENPYVTPGQPAVSELWKRMGEDKDMPPSGAMPSEDDLRLIQNWIVAGAEFPRDELRKPVSEAAVLGRIVEHLRQLDPADRPRWRYFTLTSLHNNPRVSDDELRLARAGISKLLNSLSSRRRIVVPEVLGPEQAVLALDVTGLGWDARAVWDRVLKAYPYGLSYRNRPAGDALRKLAVELDELVGEEAGPPDVRADWFLDTAARPELYHAILNLPLTAGELESRLGVDVERDYLGDQLRRAGFTASGVSSQNRLVDRHDATSGYYWKSYDFRNTDGTGNILRFPLGPAFKDNPHAQLAFEHAGGEIVFSLPNGLQGYLLIDARGNRIDSGPAEVVGDSLRTSSTTLIVNGLSCMACHRTGIVRFQDRLRAGAAVSGSAREKLERLTPTKAEWEKILAADEAQFLAAAEQATGRFLQVGADRAKPIREFPEPITAIARLYQKDLGCDEVVAELGLADVKDLLVRIRNNPALGKLGLGVLSDGGAVKRAEWCSLKDRTLSTFHEVSLQLRHGTPQRRY